MFVIVQHANLHSDHALDIPFHFFLPRFLPPLRFFLAFLCCFARLCCELFSVVCFLRFFPTFVVTNLHSLNVLYQHFHLLIDVFTEIESLEFWWKDGFPSP